MAIQRVKNTICSVRGGDSLGLVVDTVDANGWRWLLVAVGDGQAGRCSENSGNTDRTTHQRQSAVGQKHRTIQPRIVELHREVSQAVLHEDSHEYSFKDRCQHASGWELGSNIAMT